MPDLDLTIAKMRQRTASLRAIGVDLSESLGTLRTSPRNTCTCNAIAVEAVLKHVWRAAKISGDPDQKLIEDLVTQVTRVLKDQGAPMPRRVLDKIRSVQSTRNRACHHQPDDVVTEDDAIESLHQLEVVLDWCLSEFPGEGPPGATTDTLPANESPATNAPPTGTRVVILYKRGGEPDEQVLRWLESQLRARGCTVFIDRHLDVGVEWAMEIDREIRGAEFVIVLLSAASLKSEMIAHEVITARDAAARQGGQPRLLPVRVRFADALTGELGAILGPVQQFTWSGPQDNAVLIEQVRHKIENPTEEPPRARVPRLEPESGAVRIDSRFYVVRRADNDIYSALGEGERMLLIKGPRQVGKTSLLSRALEHARGAGFRVVITDFQALSGEDLVSAKTFWLALGTQIADQLGLENFPHDTWRKAHTTNENIKRYFRTVLLEAAETPLLWAMDEADRIFPSKFSSEVFGLLRSWHEAATLDPRGPWGRLTMAIAYATEAHHFIKDLNQSPFNVGRRFEMRGFTREQTADLNTRYGGPLSGEAELDRFQRLTGGHPFLVRRGLREMVDRQLSVAMFEAVAAQENGPFGDQLKRTLVQVSCDPSLKAAAAEVLAGRPCTQPDAFYALQKSGILAGDMPAEARWSCEVYGRFLKRHLG